MTIMSHILKAFNKISENIFSELFIKQNNTMNLR